MERTVVVFHFGRSGSRVLGKLLGQHPDIGWGGEVLKTPEVERFRERLTDPESYDPFDHLATLCEEREKPWLGIEIKFFHLRKRGVSLEDFVSRVAEMGCRHFVVLQRRNVLRKIVSSMVAKQTRSYHQAADKAAELNTIEIQGVSKKKMLIHQKHAGSLHETEIQNSDHMMKCDTMKARQKHWI